MVAALAHAAYAASVSYHTYCALCSLDPRILTRRHASNRRLLHAGARPEHGVGAAPGAGHRDASPTSPARARAIRAAESISPFAPSSSGPAVERSARAAPFRDASLRAALEAIGCSYLDGCTALDLDRDGVVGDDDLARFFGWD